MQQKSAVSPFSLMSFIREAAEGVKSNASFSAGESQIEALFSAVKLAEPDEVSCALRSAYKSSLYAFVLRGGGQWTLYTSQEVMDAVDIPFTDPGVIQPKSASESATRTLTSYDDPLRTFCLSTSNISPRTRRWLERSSKCIDAVIDHQYGFLIKLLDPSLDKQAAPVDLSNLICIFNLAGYSQIVLNTESTATVTPSALEVG